MCYFVVGQIQNFELQAPLQTSHILDLVSRKVKSLKIGAISDGNYANYVSFVQIQEKNRFEVEFLSLSLNV